MIDGITGVRFARGCHPDDLWTTYFTSSKYVHQMRAEHGEPDVIEVRQTFNDSLQAREWEHKVLSRLDVIHSEKWLNKATGKSIPPQFNRFFSKETRQKISEANFKRGPRSLETRQKISSTRIRLGLVS